MPKAKRPVLLESMMSGAIPEPMAPGAVQQPAPAPRPEVEKLTVYIPRACAKRLKQMALDTDRKVNDFLREGVDMMLAKYGQPSLASYEPPPEEE